MWTERRKTKVLIRFDENWGIFANSQATGEPSCLVLNHRWLWRFAHNDKFLVRLHNDAGKLREPYSHMNESVSFQNATPGEIGDFQLIIHLRWIGTIGLDGA